jgi:hypothetical protein
MTFIPKRREIITDALGNISLGERVLSDVPGASQFRTVGINIVDNPASKTGIASLAQLLPSSPQTVLKNIMQMPTTPAVLPPALRPVELTRHIPTVHVRMPSAATAMSTFLPNTPSDRVLHLARQIRDRLLSRLPNISINDITNMLHKIKTPALVILGITALAGIIYAGYSIYRRFKKTTITNTVHVPTEIISASAVPITTPLATAHEIVVPPVVYHSDLIDILNELRVRHPNSYSRPDQGAALITKLRTFAESHDDISDFIAKVASLF